MLRRATQGRERGVGGDGAQFRAARVGPSLSALWVRTYLPRLLSIPTPLRWEIVVRSFTVVPSLVGECHIA